MFKISCEKGCQTPEYKYKADLLNYEKNLYEAKQSGFKGFAYRCERFM